MCTLIRTLKPVGTHRSGPELTVTTVLSRNPQEVRRDSGMRYQIRHFRPPIHARIGPFVCLGGGAGSPYWSLGHGHPLADRRREDLPVCTEAMELPTEPSERILSDQTALLVTGRVTLLRRHAPPRARERQCAVGYPPVRVQCVGGGSRH